MKVLKFIVWFLWLMFMMFIIYAIFVFSKWWFVGFFLWFIPAHFIMDWIESGVIKELENDHR